MTEDNADGRQPQTARYGKEDGVDLAIANGSARYLFQRLETHSVEAKNSLGRRQPKISVARLLNVKYRAEAVFRSPFGMVKVTARR